MPQDAPLQRRVGTTSSPSERLRKGGLTYLMDAGLLQGGATHSLSGLDAHTYEWSAIMTHSLVMSSLLGAVALAISAPAALAQSSNLGGSQWEPPLSGVGSPLVLVRGGGGGHGFGGGHGGGFGGGHGFHGGHFRGGFGAFGGPYYDDDYGDSGCSWSPRYHRWVCY